MAKEAYYFTHDYGARNDPKVQALLMEQGCRGIGIYWCLVEQLYEQGGTIQLKALPGIAFSLHEDKETVSSVVADFDLFESDGIEFWSESVNRRLGRRAEISEKRKQAALKRYENQQDNPDGDANAVQMQGKSMQMHTTVNANAHNKRKEKEIKEKEIKGYKLKHLSEVEPSDFPDLNPAYIDIARAFQNLFQANLDEAGVKSKHVQLAKGTWIDDIRLIIEADGYTLADLREIYVMLQKNQFWKKNILSTGKLREQMTKLKFEIANGNKINNRITPEATSWNELGQIIADAYSEE